MAAGTYKLLSLWGLLFASTFFHGKEANRCPGQWLSYYSTCFGVFTELTTWSNAEITCQRYGNRGHLASFLSAQESIMVSKYILNNYPEVDQVWIGFHDPKKIKRWKWSDSSTTNFRPWALEEPKSASGQFCVYMERLQDFKRWTSGNCEDKKSYICKSQL